MNKTTFIQLPIMGALCLALNFSSAQEKGNLSPKENFPNSPTAQPSDDSKSIRDGKDSRKSPAVVEIEKLISGLKDKLANPDPSDPDAHVLEKEIARSYLKLGDFENAIKHLRNSIGIQPEPPAGEFQALARLLVQAGKVNESEEILKKGFETHPQSMELLSMYAAVLSDNNKSDLAEKVLSEGLKANTDNKDLAYFRVQRLYAMTLSRNKKWKQARAEYESIIKDAGEDSEVVSNAEFYFGYGTVTERERDLEAAAQHLQKALELVPRPDRNFEPIRELMTQKMIIQGRLGSTTDPLDDETKAMAEDQLQQIDLQISEIARRLDKFRATVLNYLGYMWVDAGKNLDVAGELIKKALNLDPDSEHIIDSLGWYYFKKGQYVEAMNELSRAEAMMEEESAEVFDHLAQTYFKIGNVREAVSYLERAIKLDPENRAELEARLQDYRQAKP